MRVAVLSDIHGNLVALEAVLADLATQGVEQVVCLGDITLSGPQPHECVALIRALGCPTTLGNCDETSVRLRNEGWTPERLRGYSIYSAWFVAIDRWSVEALTEEDAAWLAALPMTVTIPLAPGVELLCAHGSPQSFIHRLLPETPEERMAEMIGPVAARALASGHTHIPMLRRLGPLTVVNPGSVGLPLRTDASGALSNPADYAEYDILTWEAGALDWEARRIAVDAEAVYAAARASGMPHPDRYRGDWRQP
jgi:predicted phosphodiesterase